MKRTKNTDKLLLAISKQLPREQYASQSAIILTGSEMIESGQKVVEMQQVVSDEKYIQYLPLNKDKNHYRRMKRAFDSNGIVGIKNYLLPYLKNEYRGDFFKMLESSL